MRKLIPILFLLLFAEQTFSADENGYTSKYQCEAGAANCDVDVATYAAASCDQTITTGAWSTINWANNVICIDVRDHKSKGTLVLGSSGTSGTRKVLRCVTSSDPWSVAAGSRCVIESLSAGNRAYWIIDRIAVDPDGTPDTGEDGVVDIRGSSNNIIFNRVLIEDIGTDYRGFQVQTSGVSNITLQNSVVRDCRTAFNKSPVAVSVWNAVDVRVVNNEIYDCTSGVYSGQSGSTTPGLVVENNDIYFSPAFHTTGGTLSKGEVLWSTKDSGTAAKPKRIIHNRFWGYRPSDTSVCCDGGGTNGSGLGIGGGGADGDYNLVQNNIITDANGGIALEIFQSGNLQRNSIIGNIFHGCRTYSAGVSYAFATFQDIGTATSTEFYFNSIIDCEAANDGWLAKGGLSGSDFRCNVVIDSDVAQGSFGSGSQIDYNTYYGTTDSGEANKRGNYPLLTRANNTSYSVGQVIRTVSTPPANGTAGDFLYKVTVAGQSAGSPPSYCTSIGCTNTDGAMTVQAIRGPYTFKRKLRTVAGGETSVIPYARAGAGAFEAGFCPSHIGSLRSGIGVDDTPIN